MKVGTGMVGMGLAYRMGWDGKGCRGGEIGWDGRHRLPLSLPSCSAVPPSNLPPSLYPRKVAALRKDNKKIPTLAEMEKKAGRKIVAGGARPGGASSRSEPQTP